MKKRFYDIVKSVKQHYTIIYKAPFFGVFKRVSSKDFYKNILLREICPNRRTEIVRVAVSEKTTYKPGVNAAAFTLPASGGTDA